MSVKGGARGQAGWPPGRSLGETMRQGTAIGRWLMQARGREPTIADLVCLCDIAFAEISEIDLGPWANVSNWAARVAALPGFKLPFELLSMADAGSAAHWKQLKRGNLIQP